MQKPLTPAERLRISSSARLALANAAGHGFRCANCGCVYVRRLDGNSVLGFLNDRGERVGWQSGPYA